MTGPLSGFRVVSLTHFLQGPSCVQFLADLGADVIKVERIGGAYERHWSGAQAFLEKNSSVFFMMAGRNQRCMELDITVERGRAALWRLIEQADILVENFRPGTLHKLGFDHDAVKARNPRIVYCSLSGYGSTGPSRNQPGQDLLLQSASGLMTLSGRADDPPMPVGSAIVDQHAATLGAMGVLAALLRRERTGLGSKVDGNLLSAALDLQLEPFNYYLNGEKLYDRSLAGVSSRFHQAPYGVFKTSDGWMTLSIAGGPALAHAFDDQTFAPWTRDDQFERREQITELVAKHMVSKTTAEWEQRFREIGLWFSRVRKYDDVAADPQLAANQSILEFDDPHAGPVRLLAHPIQYDGQAPGLRLPPPSLGQHTSDILRELGFDEAEIHAMRNAYVIGPDRDAPQTTD